MAKRKFDFQEFQAFLSNSKVEPPEELTDRIVSVIRRKMNPSIPYCLAKQFCLHTVGSVTTLVLCPQFGFSLPRDLGVMDFMMRIHPALCFVVCGGIWALGALIVAKFFLNWDERRALHRYGVGTGLGFVGGSLLLVACFGHLSIDVWLAVWLASVAAVLTAFHLSMAKKLQRFKVHSAAH